VVRPAVLAFAAARGSTSRPALPESAVARLTAENLALARQHPERAAELVREWLREAAPVVEG
jgi:hypothetical protein